MSLANKRIVIIGGSSGLGLATAKAAVAAGAEVIIASRSAERLEKAKAEIGGNVQVITLDVTAEGGVKAFFERIGPFDHLVTPGNEGAFGPFLEMETEVGMAAFNSKFWGQYRAAKYGAPKLREGGSITLFAGAYAHTPEPGSAILTTINAAVEGLGRALAVELSPLRVNVVSPGLTDTPMYAGWSAEQRESVYKAVAASLPAQRIGAPEDIAESVIYLMINGFTTGSVLHPDGGATLR
jgi:NAD(P)-dependent dehydrogenase (short-subunit alcohol dehydrogenase family)